MNPRLMVFRTLCIIVTLSVVIVYPLAAKACSWPEGYRLTEADVIERFCNADAVFVGKVESSSAANDEITESKIWPEKIHKGRLSAPTYAIQARDIRAPKQGLCNFQFQPTGRYLIFADRYEELDYLCVSACDLSQPFNIDSFVNRVIESIEDVRVECGEEASKNRRAENRRRWIEKLAGEGPKVEELEEAARLLREASQSDANSP